MHAKALVKHFANLSQDLTYELNSDCNLHTHDSLLLQNYLLSVQLAYNQWKRRNAPSSSAALSHTSSWTG